ncbi:MAG: ABC transporter substrate-binding protein [Saprospiraceae bacterium]|nr:ABC transporter substrate-binding protein [Saprospiraceae bacterium]
MLLEQGKIPENLALPPAPKIISLVPSLSWYVQDLQPGLNLIGITKFCIPQPDKAIPQHLVGGTKTPTLKKILELKPDLILANKEENTEKDILALSKHHFVYLSNVESLNDMYQMMRDIGMLCNRRQEAQFWIDQIEMKQREFLKDEQINRQIPVSYLIWRKPWMVAAKQTFIHHILELSGMFNVFGHLSRYPVVEMEDIRSAQPDYLLLSSEPYPFKTRHFQEFSPCKCLIVDGRMFSWYGSYMEKSFSYLKALKLKMRSIYE